MTINGTPINRRTGTQPNTGVAKAVEKTVIVIGALAFSTLMIQAGFWALHDMFPAVPLASFWNGLGLSLILTAVGTQFRTRQAKP